MCEYLVTCVWYPMFVVFVIMPANGCLLMLGHKKSMIPSILGIFLILLHIPYTWTIFNS